MDNTLKPHSILVPNSSTSIDDVTQSMKLLNIYVSYLLHLTSLAIPSYVYDAQAFLPYSAYEYWSYKPQNTPT